MKPAGYSSDEDEDFEDDFFSITPLPKSNRNQEKKSLSELLPEKIDGGLKDLIDNCNKSASFHRAVEACDFKTMQELIDSGVSVDESRISEWTPLMKACSKGNTQVVEFLLNNGADPNLHKELFTPLMACCIDNYVPIENRLQCMRLLINKGADVNRTDRFKSCVLIQAAANGFEQIVDELISLPNIDLNIGDSSGWTALFHAVFQNHKSIVQKLIDAGIDVNVVGADRFTALQIAKLKNNMNIIKMLEGDENVVEHVSLFKDPLQEFLDEFPDANGKGGFYSEVRNIFLGVGLERLYDELKIDISLPEFLLLDDLSKIGITLEPIKDKIMQTGIHKYYVHPWQKSSLHQLPADKSYSLADFVNYMSNVVKHLVILHATLAYVKKRAAKTVRNKRLDDKKMVKTMVFIYREIQITRRTLRSISHILNSVKSAGDVEADFVGPETSEKRKMLRKCMWAIAGTLTVASAYVFYKFK